ncbi:hypothetical protein PR048_009512 [Dryococelus australis]|uniref:Uncharacterized protein n=1 Tax=Dryococelus australis TaxID=614101 RepID=A0ABQ9I035_9NEOP|nr:hypothetical protein PR048_009512 [Dryococelus australis]
MTLSSESGYSDWKHMSELLSEHETSPHHMKAYQSWSECKRWREGFKWLVSVIGFLGSQNLAFRGKSGLLYQRNNGNFRKILEFIGKFDVIIADHLWRIK